ncbi:ROK family glucokinase [Trueperella bialowiezensis]|uniref:Glucokinase n=1 Tax=Trueperella bialowiezensis TaxID=312285 RepID=A0A448PF27_9ACTO|nr:ROK family glucokinase [Trueperella bialowiezensis]VEI13543.1 Glucokinase [Trueperella bialowiezensis]
MTMTIGVDIGGTKIAAGLVDNNGNIVHMLRRPSPARDTTSVIATVLSLVAELQQTGEATAIGVGAAGFVNSTRDRVIFAPNLAWRDEPLGDQLARETGLPTIIENDANAAAWGEFRFGAAKEYSSAAVITIGTGIGGGIILGGELLRGATGFAGEIGHLNMVAGGVPCGCGQRGCWEVYSSGGALLRAARENARTDRERSAMLLDLAGGDPENITGLMVTEAAQAGCAGALDAFQEIGNWLGQGMADLGALLDPEVFVLAGGVSEAGSVLLTPATDAYRERLTASQYRQIAPVVLAELGNDAGIIGAADLARHHT